MSTPSTEIRKSACPLDCPDACSLDVTVGDGRVESLDGNHANPVTDGYICGKVRHFSQHMYGADRVLYPGVRMGPKGAGEFRRVTWDEALDHWSPGVSSRSATSMAARRFCRLCYGGSNGWLSQNGLDARLFHRLGASRLARAPSARRHRAAATGLYGKMPGVAYQDYPKRG